MIARRRPVARAPGWRSRRSLAAPGRADVFSPGDLSRAHASLEGLAELHQVPRRRASSSRPSAASPATASCRPASQQGKGFHGPLAPDKRACQTCHHEHQGRDFALVDWGAGGQEAASTTRATGWPLEGKHRPVDVRRRATTRASSTDARSVKAAREAAARTTLARRRRPPARPATSTSTAASSARTARRCHVGRGLEAGEGLRPRAGDVPRSTGKHAKVACAEVPPRRAGAGGGRRSARSPGAGRAPTFVALQAAPVRSRASTATRTRTRARFGQALRELPRHRGLEEASQGDREGRRVPREDALPAARRARAVACAACHGPSARRQGGLPGPRVREVHRLPLRRAPRPARPVAARPRRPRPASAATPWTGGRRSRFELEDHQRLAYPLEGAHRDGRMPGLPPEGRRASRPGSRRRSARGWRRGAASRSRASRCCGCRRRRRTVARATAIRTRASSRRARRRKAARPATASRAGARSASTTRATAGSSSRAST